MKMWCLWRTPKQHKAVQTNISYVHVMRLVQYDTGEINEDFRIVQRDRQSCKGSIPPGLCADVIETVEKNDRCFGERRRQ